MNSLFRTSNQGSFVQAIRTLFQKIMQHPDSYAIKYYKKSRRCNKPYRSQLLK